MAVTIVATFTTAATFAAMVWAWRNPWSVAFPKAGRP